MSGTVTVSVEGLSDLDRALGQLPAAWRRPVVLVALRKASAPMVADAKARAHRQANPRRRGGVRIDSRMGRKWGLGKSMADSIKFRSEGSASTGPTETSGSVGPDRGHFYAAFVERGTKAHPGHDARTGSAYVRRSSRTGKLKRGFLRKMEAKRAHAATAAYPFLAPAFQAHRDLFVPSFGAELWRSIEAKARSVARQGERGALTGKDAQALLAR